MTANLPPTERPGAIESRTTATGVAALLAGVALVAGIGTTSAGIAAGALVVGTWALAGPVYAFAFGQILFAAFAPAPTGVELAVAQAGLFGLLAVPVNRDAPLRTVGAFVVASAGLVGVGAGVRDATGELWPAALAVGAAVALVAYGLHRYELVVLDLVEADA
ncbi:hypothetical protein [Halorussus sp. MSC15.2]|uniref:hypothetical protein n=1 Tax=Halorussus sp. MSC15.2 TaxID=2283638 RepID=UPI0013D38D66|nr:hypothetical protein [Halorussus sp. MSC15.2]NEU58118.1 hypothetical protein [Halorussus sp. MSC15.2]